MLLLECDPHVSKSKFAALIRHQGSPRSCRKHRISSHQKCHETFGAHDAGHRFETGANSLKRDSANVCTSNEPLIPDLVFRVGLNHETGRKGVPKPRRRKGREGGPFGAQRAPAIFFSFLSGLNPELGEWRVSNPEGERRRRGVRSLKLSWCHACEVCERFALAMARVLKTRRVRTQARFQSQANARPPASNVDLGPHADQKTPRVFKRVRHAHHDNSLGQRNMFFACAHCGQR